MPCHCWRSSVERLHCRAQVMRKKQEPWHLRKPELLLLPFSFPFLKTTAIATLFPTLRKSSRVGHLCPAFLSNSISSNAICFFSATRVAASLVAGQKGQFSFVTSSIMSGFSSRTDLKSSGLQKSGSCC